MKWLFLLLIFLLVSCSQQDSQLTAEEIAQIKKNIIESSEAHAQAIENLDYEESMKYYGGVEDFVIFGDGYYWGDYKTGEAIWKDFLNPKIWKGKFKWDLSNHKIHVLSKDAASYLVEFDHERISIDEDTTKGHGSFSYGMKKIGGNWKIVTVHVTQNYARYDENGELRKWWLYYSPENRNKTE